MVATWSGVRRSELDDRNKHHSSVQDSRKGASEPCSWHRGPAGRESRGRATGLRPWPNVAPEKNVTNCRCCSFLASANTDIKAEHPVLIAYPDDGEVLINVVLELDDLL